MKSKPRLNLSSTATPKNKTPFPYANFEAIERQARADTYLDIAQWVKALPPTRGKKEARDRGLILAGCEAQLQDLDFTLVETNATLVDLVATLTEPKQ